VASPGIRKAALLLMGLDSSTAAELLKAADPEVVTEIAAELAYLQASGAAKPEAALEPVREFFGQLQQSGVEHRGERFIQDLLEGALGVERSREAMAKVRLLVEARDPFLSIRSAEPNEIAEALGGEPPQVAALVLAELPANKSAKVLPLLGEEVQAGAIRGMASGQATSVEARMRVATVVRDRLSAVETEAVATGGGEASKAGSDRQLRKVAVLLRDLGTDMRNRLIEAIAESDKEASDTVQELMVIWDDVPTLSDRSLQEALRAVDSLKLALAMVDADEAVIRKIRGNISERQAAMLDEEAALLSKPKDEDVGQARGEILQALRELATGGVLSFEEG